MQIGSVPMNLPQYATLSAGLARHASTPALVYSRPGILRQPNVPSPKLTLHIQSMKKSAFKMLCKSSTKKCADEANVTDPILALIPTERKSLINSKRINNEASVS